MKLYRINYKIWNWTYSDLIDREMLSVGINEEDAINRAKEKVERDARGFTAELINSVMNYKIQIVN